ncbi:hypothetical protein AGMMS49938_09840 [Fibrobacterales bacterium]|nr:hypothetical protein AGMMS49938_09840 [Fibrobacterales bacterium]
MLRSLNAGVTGLVNHQTRMDVIGNNISNVNTVGYKNRRVTFEESFNQLIKGASKSESKAGGTNPTQVGLGVAVGSIDMITTQGNLQNTGRTLDLAIEGDAFFGVSDGKGTYYTRNGAFQLDANGYIILPTNGMVLQGKMADTYGNFPAGTVVGNLQVPMSQQSPAKVTTAVDIGRNLNSDSDAKGSVSYSQRFLHALDGARDPGTNSLGDSGRTTASTLTSLLNSNGQSLNIKKDDVLTFSFFKVASPAPNDKPFEMPLTVKATPTAPATLGPNEVSTIEDLIGALASFLGADTTTIPPTLTPVTPVPDTITGAITAAIPTGGTVTLDPATGEITIDNTGNGNNPQIFSLQAKSSNPLSDSYVNKAFNFGAHLGGQYGNYPDEFTGVSDKLRRPAEQFDYVSDLMDANGQQLGFEDGDQIDVFGSVGKTSIEDGKSAPLTFATRGTGTGLLATGTLMDDLINKIRNDFKLPYEYVDKDSTHTRSVTMNGEDTGDDGIPDGSLVLRGAKGVDFAINNLAIRATNANSNATAPTYFNAAMGFTEKTKASDVGVFDTSIAVYDESGAEHVLSVQFVHTGKAGEWEWKASFAGKEDILPGSGSGKVNFGQDGTVASWLFDNGGSQLIVDPKNGSNVMRLNLNVGGPGDFRGITQFASDTTVSCQGQDGYTTGNLIEISIDEFGIVEGAFSNGTARKIAQIMVVNFANPGGLLDMTDSVYTTSANSGDPIWGGALSQSSSKIKPGALEMSNVDLANEFTNMITTQRGYQANSRVITVSDSMLEELVNLKR